MLNIIATLLSLANVLKCLLKYVLQNIILVWCYLLLKSVIEIGWKMLSSFLFLSMSNVYRQKCLFCQNFYYSIFQVLLVGFIPMRNYVVVRQEQFSNSAQPKPHSVTSVDVLQHHQWNSVQLTQQTKKQCSWHPQKNMIIYGHKSPLPIRFKRLFN